MADRVTLWLTRSLLTAGVVYLVVSVVVFVATGSRLILVHSALGTVVAALAAAKLGSRAETVSEPPEQHSAAPAS